MLGKLSDLDLRLVRVFLAIADAGGIAPAQLSLNVGASTISTQLASLETRLGYRLCERGRGGFALTAKGAAFAELARGLVAALNHFESASRHLDRRLVGELRLGLIGQMPPAQNARLGEAIARFRQRDEAVKLSLLVRPPLELEERLLSGQIDVAVTYFWHRSPALHVTPIFNERQVAYCGRAHRLFSRAGGVSPEEAEAWDWAWRTYPLPDTGMHGKPPHVGAVADNMEALSILILSGCHLGFLPEDYAAPHVAAGQMAALNGAKLSYDVPFYVMTRPLGQLNEITRAFLDDLLVTSL